VGQTVRLFIALELTPVVRQSVQQTLEDIRHHFSSRSVRWVPPQNIHLTMKFLGDTDISQIEAVSDGLHQAIANFGTLEIDVADIGCFPNAKRPRIIWLGLNDRSGHLMAVRDSIETQIAPLGFPTEKRKFSPHLTVGRMRRGMESRQLSDIGQTVSRLKVGHVDTWTSEFVSLIQSELLPSGAEYSTLYEAHFNA
jgi:2'-5' RNA ligase